MPISFGGTMNPEQRFKVPSYSIIGIVASQYLVDLLNLFSQGIMPDFPHQ
jgi:hypothetical protein